MELKDFLVLLAVVVLIVCIACLWVDGIDKTKDDEDKNQGWLE